MTLYRQPLMEVADPTEEWGPSPSRLPSLDWSALRFGPLGFGDALEDAAALGRPDAFRWTQPGYCELLYARAGFQIDFDRGCFAYLAYFIGPDPAGPMHPQLTYCTPELDDELALTRDVRVQDIKSRLGPPFSEDIEVDETVLFYEGGGVVLEFEFDARGRLKRWNLYPMGAAV